MSAGCEILLIIGHFPEVDVTNSQFSERKTFNAKMATYDLPRHDKSTSGLIFPLKMHQLLREAENRGESHIISWLPDGRSFKVHDKKTFTNQIMPNFFGSSKLKTFQRNLNLWGFKTVSKGPQKGTCSHPSFLQGLPDLCSTMKRVVIRGTSRRQAMKASSEDDDVASTPTTSTSSVDERSEWNARCSVGNASTDVPPPTVCPAVGSLDVLRVTALLKHRATALRDLNQIATCSNAFGGQVQSHWAPEVGADLAALREVLAAQLNAAIFKEAVERLLIGNC
jgi:hypothetical protein